jgi:hypothetical protein
MTSACVSVYPYEGKRVRFESQRPYDDVLSAFRTLAPPMIPPAEFPAMMMKEGGLNVAAFEKVARSQTGESGLMLFWELNHTAWLPLYGIRRKAIRWVLGNPLIAITMIRHELTAGLFAPVEFILMEEDGGRSSVVYDLPSSLIVIRDHPELLDAARVLDKKLEALVRRAMGLEASVCIA